MTVTFGRYLMEDKLEKMSEECEQSYDETDSICETCPAARLCYKRAVGSDNQFFGTQIYATTASTLDTFNSTCGTTTGTNWFTTV